MQHMFADWTWRH